MRHPLPTCSHSLGRKPDNVQQFPGFSLHSIHPNKDPIRLLSPEPQCLPSWDEGGRFSWLPNCCLKLIRQKILNLPLKHTRVRENVRAHTSAPSLLFYLYLQFSPGHRNTVASKTPASPERITCSLALGFSLPANSG